MSNFDVVRRQLKQLLDERETKQRWFHAFTGNIDGVVVVPDMPGYIYVTDYMGLQHIAYNDQVATNRINLPVRVGYDRWNQSRLVVLGSLNSYVPIPGNPPPTYRPHHETHEAPSGEDIVCIASQQIVPGLVRPITGMTIAIYPFWCLMQDRTRRYIDYQTVNLASYKPATGALWALISFDSTGTLVIDPGATALDLANLPMIIPVSSNDSYTTIAAVCLYAGQDAVRQTVTVNDIVDLRWPGSGGVAIVDARDVTFDPTNDSDWEYLYTPSNAGGALDQLAARLTVVEAIGSAGHVIEDTGTPLTARANLNFIGATVADNPGANSTDVAIPTPNAGFVKDLTAQIDDMTAHFSTSPIVFDPALLNVSYNGSLQPLSGITPDVGNDGFTLPFIPSTGGGSSLFAFGIATSGVGWIGTDLDAIHVNADDEIHGIAEKTTPVGADVVVIEDSASYPVAYVKKRVQIANLPSGGGTDADAVHVNVDSEIHAITEKTAPVGADELVLEDSEDSFAKKRLQIAKLNPSAFLMSVHNPVDNTIYQMFSVDGIRFAMLRPDKCFATNGRDPSVIYSGGKWWMCHTGGSSFTVEVSDDLLNWSIAAAVDMTAISGFYAAWAPQWFVDADGSVHAFVACSTGGSTSNFQIYEVHPTASDMSTWSSPVYVEITGVGNAIDPCVILKGGTYYLWYKEESADYIQYASCATLTGTYADVETGDWAGWGSPNENPCVVLLDDGTWRIYFQEHSGFNPVHEYYSDSADDWVTWSAKTEVGYPWLPGGPSVLKVDGSLLSKLLAVQASTAVVGNGGGGTPVRVLAPASDLSTTSGSFAAISSSMDITVIVGASGTVWATGALSLKMFAIADCIIGIGVDAGGATECGASAWDATDRQSVAFGQIITGLSPGSHVFKLYWETSGGSTVALDAGSRGAAFYGSWWQILPL